jgi:hypothetical protein
MVRPSMGAKEKYKLLISYIGLMMTTTEGQNMSLIYLIIKVLFNTVNSVVFDRLFSPS